MKRAVKKIKQNAIQVMVLTGGMGQSVPQEIFGDIWRNFGLSPLDWVLLASSGWSPGRLLHILQSTGQPLTINNDLTPNVHSAKIERSWSRGKRAGTTSGKASRGE